MWCADLVFSTSLIYSHNEQSEQDNLNKTAFIPQFVTPAITQHTVRSSSPLPFTAAAGFDSRQWVRLSLSDICTVVIWDQPIAQHFPSQQILNTVVCLCAGVLDSVLVC